MTDTILWNKESDHYTKRAERISGGDLYSSAEKKIWAELCLKTFKKFRIMPNKILDIGCGFGASIQALLPHFKTAKFYGFDPGKHSIRTARKHLGAPRVFFKTGFLHQLPFKEGSFDVILLTMVLQWIPRRYLVHSLAEIDRVLGVNGVIVLDDFLVDRPVRSQSIHNTKVYIFKQDYKRLFTSLLCYRELHQDVKNPFDDSRRRATVFLKKISIDKTYRLRKGPSNKGRPGK